MAISLRQFNIISECQSARLGPWQCPPFLVLMMGFITVASMIATYFVAANYTQEPQVAALIVIFVTAIFLVVGNFIIVGFNNIAQANRMKSEFISIVSHQLRSPLSVFKWTIEAMNRPQPPGSEKKIEEESSLKNLQSSTEKMIRLVNSLLAVSRIDARTFVMKRERLSLPELVRNAVEDFRTYAAASNVTLEYHNETEIPEFNGDRDHISMAIQNLIDNAIRYSRGGGKVSVSVRKKGGAVEFSVSDSGQGIPTEQQKFIFQKFFRAANSSRFQTEGTGIGLYIAKSVVETLGGKIGFHSEENRGSTFWFTLPLSPETIRAKT